MKLTIFTPTYNRKKLLNRLYQSLLMQTDQSFEWIIVDDGSTDDTQEWVKRIESNSNFKIRYIWQKNSGKHVAFNTAISESTGELFMCVDSDDFLASPQVIGQIIDEWKLIKENVDLAGIISLKALQTGEILGKKFPDNIEYATPFELARKYHSYGERNIIFRLKYLKKYSYPVFEGERFCPDSYITDCISQKYYMWLRDSVDVLCEYQEDGLSNTFSKVMKNNPKGFCVANMQIIDMEDNISEKIMTAIRFWAFKKLGKDRKIKYSGKNKTLVNLCYFPGFLFNLYYKVKL